MVRVACVCGRGWCGLACVLGVAGGCAGLVSETRLYWWSDDPVRRFGWWGPHRLLSGWGPQPALLPVQELAGGWDPGARALRGGDTVSPSLQVLGGASSGLLVGSGVGLECVWGCSLCSQDTPQRSRSCRGGREKKAGGSVPRAPGGNALGWKEPRAGLPARSCLLLPVLSAAAEPLEWCCVPSV